MIIERYYPMDRDDENVATHEEVKYELNSHESIVEEGIYEILDTITRDLQRARGAQVMKWRKS
jgi:hypothetical protein